MSALPVIIVVLGLGALRWFRPERAAPPRPPRTRPPLPLPWQEGHYVTYYGERYGGQWIAFQVFLIGKKPDGSWRFVARGKEATHDTRVMFGFIPGATPGSRGEYVPVQGPEAAKVTRGTVPDNRSGDIAHLVRILNLFIVAAPQGQAEMSGASIPSDLPCGITEVYPLRIAVPLPNEPDRYLELSPLVPLAGVARDSFAGREAAGLVVTSFGHAQSGGPRFWDYVDLGHLETCEYEGFTLIHPATWFLDPTDSSNQRHVCFGFVHGGRSCALAFMVKVDQEVFDAEAEAGYRQSLAESAPDRRSANMIHVQHMTKPLAEEGQYFMVQGEAQGIKEVEVRIVRRSLDTNQVALIALSLSVANAHPEQSRMLAELPLLGERIGTSFRFKQSPTSPGSELWSRDAFA